MSGRRDWTEQRREVEGWRGSGESAARYAAPRGYSSASLLRWAKAGALVAKSSSGAPEFVRIELARATSLVVEVGRARIVIERGFDGAQLRAVVAALSAEGAP